ncbi:MAG: hypothetical protein Kow0032_01280 [Methyloligellaceae bacterium]
MTGSIAEIAGGLLLALGAFFFVVGAIGIYRFPDVYARMHAAGISDTVGVALLIAGMMLFSGFTLITAKLAIILGVILFTSPIATHALAQAALHAGVEPLLANGKLLAGPGVKPEPAKAGRAVARSRSAAAKRKRPVKKAARTARKASPKGRTKS